MRALAKRLRQLQNWWFFIFGLILPTQLGKHFWPAFSYLNGIRVDYLSPTIFLTDVWLLVSLLLYFPKLKKIKFNFILVGFCLLLGLNFIIAANKFLFAWRFIAYLKVIWIAFLFAQNSPRKWNLFLKGLGCGIIYTLILSIGQIINHRSLQGLWYYLGERLFTINTPGISTVSLNGQKVLRAYATFSHPNSLAGFALISALLFFHFKKKFLGFLSLVIVLLAFSKFAFLILAGLVFWQLFRASGTCRLCRIVKILLFFWLATLSVWVQNDPSSLSIRLVSYKEHLGFVLSHPWGQGLGNFLVPGLSPFLQPVHNIFLLLTVEWGWFIWPYILLLIKKAINNAQAFPSLAPLLLILLFTLSFDHYWGTLIQNLNLLGVVLGFISALSPRRQKSS